MLKWLSVLAFIFTASLFANSSGEKVYLLQENIALCNHQILVGRGHTWMPVSQLAADEKGFYVMKQNLSSFFQWACEHCGAENWIWDDTCWVCGRERD